MKLRIFRTAIFFLAFIISSALFFSYFSSINILTGNVVKPVLTDARIAAAPSETIGESKIKLDIESEFKGNLSKEARGGLSTI